MNLVVIVTDLVQSIPQPPLHQHSFLTFSGLQPYLQPVQVTVPDVASRTNSPELSKFKSKAMETFSSRF